MVQAALRGHRHTCSDPFVGHCTRGQRTHLHEGSEDPFVVQAAVKGHRRTYSDPFVFQAAVRGHRRTAAATAGRRPSSWPWEYPLEGQSASLANLSELLNSSKDTLSMPLSRLSINSINIVMAKLIE